MEELIKIDSVDKYNKLFGLETLQPMVAVIDLSKATVWPEHFKINYGCLLYTSPSPRDCS